MDADLAGKLEILRLVLEPEEYANVSECLSALVHRALIGRLATDPHFLPLREFPSVYGGESAQRIEARLLALGVEADACQQLVAQLRKILVRGVGSNARVAPISDAVVRLVCARLAGSGWETMRCMCCGYHFRPADMSESRRKIADQCGLTLSQAMRPERVADSIKTVGFTTLHVDHIVPRAGWGPTDTSNLQLLCELCNQGKSLYHNGQEAASPILAGAYSLFDSCSYRPNRTIFYSCVVFNGSLCDSCGKTARECELTVRRKSEWFTPWTVDVVCYECLGGALSS